MDLPPSIQLDRRRRRRKRHAAASQPTPPGPVDQVVSVVIDGTNAVIVTTAAEVASIVDPALAMWIRPSGGGFLNAIAWEILAPTETIETRRQGDKETRRQGDKVKGSFTGFVHLVPLSLSGASPSVGYGCVGAGAGAGAG